MLRAFQVCPKALGERASREDCGVGSKLVDLRSASVGEPKAAASDEEKRMWKMYEETGIFACACRHHMMVYIADMVRSGER